MITPDDRTLMAVMISREFVDHDKYPDGFLEEYAVRLGMIKRAGVVTPGLGPLALMQLLRDFKVRNDTVEQVMQTVNNWRIIPIDTRIMMEGRRGLFKGVLGEGRIEVKLDGYKAHHEVPAASVTLVKPRVDGVDDKEFENEPLNAAQEQLLRDERDQQSDEFDETWLAWNNVDPGTEVEYTDDKGTVCAGNFIDVKDGKILLDAAGETVTLDPEVCVRPEPAAT